jgi:hypothetical protein
MVCADDAGPLPLIDGPAMIESIEDCACRRIEGMIEIGTLDRVPRGASE